MRCVRACRVGPAGCSHGTTQPTATACDAMQPNCWDARQRQSAVTPSTEAFVLAIVDLRGWRLPTVDCLATARCQSQQAARAVCTGDGEDRPRSHSLGASRYACDVTELQVTVPDEIAERLASEASEHGTSVEDVIAQVLGSHLPAPPGRSLGFIAMFGAPPGTLSVAEAERRLEDGNNESFAQ